MTGPSREATRHNSRSRGHRLLRAIGVLLAVVGGLMTLPPVVLLIVPSLQALNRPLAFLTCTIPYISIPLVILGLGLFLALPRRRRLVGIGLIAVSLVAASAPWWRFPMASTPHPTVSDLRVFSLNAEFGQADQGAILQLAQSADILAFQENTPEFVQSLEDKGLLNDFPYRLGTAEYESYGTMIWSRTPLTMVANGNTRYTSLVVRTTVHDTAWTVSTLHAVSPKDGSGVWEQDGAAIGDLLRPYVGEHLVVVGDFNAIDEHLTMRRIRDVGLQDSMTGWPLAPGDGFQNSWPNDPRLPLLIRIDHALHSASVDAWRPRYVTISGTDHRALLATFAPH
jgi:endonuclease/exonuclease/phosphatase (EEP) superfamily protein YafD